MKTISLSKEQFALVDDEDHDYLILYNWHVDGKGYARRNLNDENRSTIRMHQHILGKVEGKQIDHINGNRLDNQRSNLRYVDLNEQARNVGMKKNNTSGFKGVCHRKNGKWVAQITWHGRVINLGYYFTASDAAKAYDKKAKELFGEFAKTNEELGNFNT